MMVISMTGFDLGGHYWPFTPYNKNHGSYTGKLQIRRSNIFWWFWTFPSRSFEPNSFPQTSHAISFWWIVLVCALSIAAVLKVFPHFSQMNGRSVWWETWWFLRADADEYVFSHWLHWNGLFSGNLWIFKWVFKLEFVENFFPHSPHSNGRSPVWVL